jgi:hypothetical protein
VFIDGIQTPLHLLVDDDDGLVSDHEAGQITDITQGSFSDEADEQPDAHICP